MVARKFLACLENWNRLPPAVFAQKNQWRLRLSSDPHQSAGLGDLCKTRRVKLLLYDIPGNRRVTDIVLEATL